MLPNSSTMPIKVPIRPKDGSNLPPLSNRADLSAANAESHSLRERVAQDLANWPKVEVPRDVGIQLHLEGLLAGYRAKEAEYSAIASRPFLSDDAKSGTISPAKPK